MTFPRKRKTSLPPDEPICVLQPADSPAKRFKLQPPSLSPSTQTSPPESPSLETLSSQDRIRQHFYRVIQSMDKDSLSHILSTLLLKHAYLETEVQQLLPKPTLSNVSRLLSDSEKRLNDAFPYSKHAPGRSSDYAFNRVRYDLLTFFDF